MSTDPAQTPIVVPAEKHRALADHHGPLAAAEHLARAVPTARTLCRRWDLQPGQALGHGVQSLTMPVTLASGGAAVLKVPFDVAQAHLDIAALRQWEAPAPRVLGYDAPSGGALLELLTPQRPGYTPAQLVRVMGQLHVPAPTWAPDLTSRLALRTHWAQQFQYGGPARERHLEDLEVAEVLLTRLVTTDERVLLHADLRHTNLVPTSEGLRVIDPMPAAGPRYFDPALWVAWGGRDTVTDFGTLIDQLCDPARTQGEAALDPEVLTMWVWCTSVLENQTGRRAERIRTSFLDLHRTDMRIAAFF